MRIHAVFVAFILVPATTQAAHAAGDPEQGAKVFRQCVACHSTAAGQHLTGPSLAQVWKSKAGTTQGFTRYSDAMKRAGVTWDSSSLDKWLSDPERFMPGTSMAFAGIKDAQSRQDVIAYLEAVAEKKAPARPQGRGMMDAGRKPDLRKAPPAGQVRSIKYCGDAYTIETADGKREKIWEFNLRLKTDSSDLGPSPGKPVVLGAGMRGDRASVIFASPSEISSFIKQSCE